MELEDLYLATACTFNSESAWTRFAVLYENHISNMAHKVCSSHDEAREIADSLLAHVFFPDRAGRSRIASYEVRGSLRTWLSTIIKHQALNQRQLKSSGSEPLDLLRHVECAEGTSELDAAVLRSKYGEAIDDSFKAAAGQLNERERLVLLLRFGEEMSGIEIARMLDVHQSQIARSIKQAQLRFRRAALTRLEAHHELSPQAIHECITVVLGVWESSIIALLADEGSLRSPVASRLRARSAAAA